MANPKKVIRRPLKPRDYRFLKAKAKNPDMADYKAAMVATGTKDMKVASVQAVRMLENVSLREAVDETMVKLGFSMEGIIQPVRTALDDESLDQQLKGHDRAMKLLQIAHGEQAPNGNTTVNFNFRSD